MNYSMQFHDIGFAAGAHHDAVRVLLTQRGLAICLSRFITNHVNLVKHAYPRHAAGTDFLQYLIRHRELPFKAGIARIDDVEQQRGF